MNYLIKGTNDPEVSCSLDYLDFQIKLLTPGDRMTGASGDTETGITILYGKCDITVDGGALLCSGDRSAQYSIGDGDTLYGAGDRDRVMQGNSPHVTLIPPGSSYLITALSDVKLSVSRTSAGGFLNQVTHIPAGSIEGVRRGTGKTERMIYDLIPEGVNTKLMIYEVYTYEGNWSSFPPHKHDVDSGDESLLQEVYYFTFDPPEGFALVWLCDDDGDMDSAYAVRTGDLELIPRGYHTMAVSPGYLCSTHAVMAGPTNDWKIHFKEEFKHLYDWDK